MLRDICAQRSALYVCSRVPRQLAERGDFVVLCNVSLGYTQKKKKGDWFLVENEMGWEG